MNQLEARLVMALAGLIFITGGLAFAADYRGFVAWQARKSIASIQWLEKPLSRIPPWSFLLKRMTAEKRVQQQIGTARAFGILLILMGVTLVVAAFIAHDIRVS
jgi:hypothetical protein